MYAVAGDGREGVDEGVMEFSGRLVAVFWFLRFIFIIIFMRI